MKKFSRKWLILEHYKQVAELKKEGVTVRLWKPKTMERLPAYKMKDTMDWYLGIFRERYRWEEKVTWNTDNPDVGLWDAQTVIRYDPRNKSVDIYICALLMRPFSDQARDHYEQRMGLPFMDRLLLMWDSRQFDRDGGYNTVNGIVYHDDRNTNYESLFIVQNEDEDIEDHSTFTNI